MALETAAPLQILAQEDKGHPKGHTLDHKPGLLGLTPRHQRPCLVSFGDVSTQQNPAGTICASTSLLLMAPWHSGCLSVSRLIILDRCFKVRQCTRGQSCRSRLATVSEFCACQCSFCSRCRIITLETLHRGALQGTHTPDPPQHSESLQRDICQTRFNQSW